MKTINIEIPEGKEAKWVNGVLTLVDEQPKDITESIKTFEDAYAWCRENGHRRLAEEYYAIDNTISAFMKPTKDLIAYLKLRIITCALNRGWEPTFEDGEGRYYGWYSTEKGSFVYKTSNSYGIGSTTDCSSSLVFKTEELAEYAATQFKDIYMDFCYKRKE